MLAGSGAAPRDSGIAIGLFAAFVSAAPPACAPAGGCIVWPGAKGRPCARYKRAVSDACSSDEGREGALMATSCEGHACAAAPAAQVTKNSKGGCCVNGQTNNSNPRRREQWGRGGRRKKRRTTRLHTAPQSRGEYPATCVHPPSRCSPSVAALPSNSSFQFLFALFTKLCEQGQPMERHEGGSSRGTRHVIVPMSYAVPVLDCLSTGGSSKKVPPGAARQQGRRRSREGNNGSERACPSGTLVGVGARCMVAPL
jgi:hypothetical protein